MAGRDLDKAFLFAAGRRYAGQVSQYSVSGIAAPIATDEDKGGVWASVTLGDGCYDTDVLALLGIIEGAYVALTVRSSTALCDMRGWITQRTIDRATDSMSITLALTSYREVINSVVIHDIDNITAIRPVGAVGGGEM